MLDEKDIKFSYSGSNFVQLGKTKSVLNKRAQEMSSYSTHDYSQYVYVEAFLDMKQKSWINAHVHMYEYYGGAARILVPDNCKTAVVHNGGRKGQQINETYLELAEHYGTAIIPACVRTPKDYQRISAIGSLSLKPYIYRIP